MVFCFSISKTFNLFAADLFRPIQFPWNRNGKQKTQSRLDIILRWQRYLCVCNTQVRWHWHLRFNHFHYSFSLAISCVPQCMPSINISDNLTHDRAFSNKKHNWKAPQHAGMFNFRVQTKWTKFGWTESSHLYQFVLYINSNSVQFHIFCVWVVHLGTTDTSTATWMR